MVDHDEGNKDKERIFDVIVTKLWRQNKMVLYQMMQAFLYNLPGNSFKKRWAVVLIMLLKKKAVKENS